MSPGLTLVHFARCWARVLADDLGDHKVYVRFAVVPSGRLRVAELRVVASDGVGAEMLRRVPLGRVEAMVNSPELADAVRADVEAATKVERDIGPAGEQEDHEEAEVSVKRRTRRDLKLRIPDARRRPDDFYRQVAVTMATASQTTRSAAEAVAAANEVPVTTVHRWMKEARRRGVAGPARGSERA